MSVIFADLAVGDTLPELRLTISATQIVAGALASRDYSPLHHDHNYARETAKQRDIFANTQFQAALFERYLQDWAGPMCRTARMKFLMINSIFPASDLTIRGKIAKLGSEECGPAATIEIEARVEDLVATACTVLLALPADTGDNPWSRTGTNWLRRG
ncbi:hotdog family protein [Erythrobacter aurantius]|uniref:MaoC/PaaZ C-terminal domain-containing protein n=1 Tax=Erythrobacter aurantius TaxID=2909249 RepID=UPI002079C703|nr:MaoC/PaaZ C-terminal domain-containing protein [Erythrobacter aurantius]